LADLADVSSFPDTTQDSGLSLGGGWSTVDENNDTIVELEVSARTDGSSRANIYIRVDESGGTTEDYHFRLLVPTQLGSNGELHSSFTVYLPAGGQINIDNVDDPDGANSLRTDRVVVL
jgi:hypothetical protein